MDKEQLKMDFERSERGYNYDEDEEDKLDEWI